MHGTSGSLPRPELGTFCLAYELGSFTKAAERLGITPQAASRAVARLEASLGVSLFRRTTRSLAPTSEGRQYYATCRHALGLLDEAARQLSSGQRTPKGEVRLSVPSTYGLHRLLPSLGRFRDRFPGIEVGVHLSSRNVDFVHDEIDLAIRMGAITDGSLVRRPLGTFALGVFGSPAYLGRRGAPSTVDDLAGHATIAFVMPSSGRLLPWELVEQGKRRTWVPQGAYRVSGDVLGTIALATAGAGLIQTYHFLVERELARGELVAIMVDHGGAARPFSLVYPAGRTLGRPVRAMVDFILEEAGVGRGTSR